MKGNKAVVIYDIDIETAKRLNEWCIKNIKGKLPLFYSKVQLNLAPDPLPISVKVTKQKNDIVFYRIDKSQQLSFYEDTKREMDEHSFAKAYNTPIMADTITDRFLKEQLDLMRSRPEFKTRTTVAFSFKEKDGKIKIADLPTLEEWYGFSPKLNWKLQCAARKRVFGDLIQEETYEESLENQNMSMKEVFLMQAEKIRTVFRNANDFLYMANKDPKGDRFIKASSLRDEEGNKVIAFRLLKERSEDPGEIYAVELPESEGANEKGVYSVRGHLRRLDSPFYKEAKGRVIWVNAFVKGMPEEYYEEKRKERRKEKREDASLEDPKSWVTDIDAGKER